MPRFATVAVVAVLVLAFAAPLANADVMPENVQTINAEYTLSWDAEEFAEYSFFALAWKFNVDDDDKATRVSNGGKVDHRYMWGVYIYAVKTDAEASQFTVAELKAMDGFAVGEMSVSRYVDEGSPIHARKTFLSVKEIKDGTVALETARVIETNKDGDVLRDTAPDSDDGEDGEGSDEGADGDDDGIPQGDEFRYNGRDNVNAATILLALAGLAAVGLAIALVTRFRA